MIKNKKNATTLVRRLLKEIINIVGKRPDFGYIDDRLDIRNIDVKFSTKIDNIFKKYENIFIINDIWMKWINSTSEEVILIAPSTKNDSDLNFDFHNTGKLLTTYHMKIKDIYLKRVKATKYIYHTTKKENKQSIIKNGLVPKLNKNFLDSDINLSHPKAIFATMSNIKDVWQYNPDENDLWQIDTSKIDNKWFQDLNMPNWKGLIVTYDKIPFDAIELRNDYFFLKST